MMLLTLKLKRRINLNQFAVEISRREGGRKQVDIAQIKEVLRHTLALLGEEWSANPRGVVELLER